MTGCSSSGFDHDKSDVLRSPPYRSQCKLLSFSFALEKKVLWGFYPEVLETIS